jgi:hypothetical protein
MFLAWNHTGIVVNHFLSSGLVPRGVSRSSIMISSTISVPFPPRDSWWPIGREVRVQYDIILSTIISKGNLKEIKRWVRSLMLSRKCQLLIHPRSMFDVRVSSSRLFQYFHIGGVVIVKTTTQRFHVRTLTHPIPVPIDDICADEI